MKKHKRYRNQIKDDKRKEYDEMETSCADMTNSRRHAYSVQHPDGYSDGEHSYTHNTSMAGELIRVQSEQIRRITAEEYIKGKYIKMNDGSRH